jgi:hypothetical protein
MIVRPVANKLRSAGAFRQSQSLRPRIRVGRGIDEPTNNLGTLEYHKVLELIRMLKGRDTPVILITHVMPDARSSPTVPSSCTAPKGRRKIAARTSTES